MRAAVPLVPTLCRDPTTGATAIAETDRAAVLAVNQAFYTAFETADLDAMSAVWEHSDRVVCTHPGWAMLRGWGSVSASWFALFGGQQRLQFILTEARVDLRGSVAVVTLDENLIGIGATGPGGGVGGTIAALNLFTEAADGWRMIAHHGSPVVDQGEPPRDRPGRPSAGAQ
jgi:ketosteroid isomerase-like protein